MTENTITPNAIIDGLNTRFIGQKVIYYASTASTNEIARQEAHWGAAAGTVIITDEQVAGRGRLKRAWLSPKGGLALSVILRPNIAYLPYMIMIASLAVVYSMEKVTGLKAQIKWPNDVLLQGKKVCGILIETDVRKNGLNHVVIGIGINVNLHLADFPDIASLATSLSDQLGKEVSRLDLTRQLLIELEKLYLTLPEPETIFKQWRALLITLGKKVQVKFQDTVMEGIAESVAGDGNLMLRRQDGSLINIVAGDVTLHV